MQPGVFYKQTKTDSTALGFGAIESWKQSLRRPLAG